MIYAIFIGIIIGIIINVYIKKSEYYVCSKAIDKYVAPVACAALLLFLYRVFGFSKLMLIYSAQLSISVAIVIIDIKTKTIPKFLLLLCFISAAVFLLFFKNIDLVSGLIGCIASGSILLVLSVITKGGLGAGDVVFFSTMGLTLGIEKTISALVATALLSGTIGILVVLISKENIKKRIPFTPFILLGILLSIIS